MSTESSLERERADLAASLEATLAQLAAAEQARDALYRLLDEAATVIDDIDSSLPEDSANRSGEEFLARILTGKGEMRSIADLVAANAG